MHNGVNYFRKSLIKYLSKGASEHLSIKVMNKTLALGLWRMISMEYEKQWNWHDVFVNQLFLFSPKLDFLCNNTSHLIYKMIHSLRFSIQIRKYEKNHKKKLSKNRKKTWEQYIAIECFLWTQETHRKEKKRHLDFNWNLMLHKKNNSARFYDW